MLATPGIDLPDRRATLLDLQSGLGEALTGDAGGVVTADARAAFERAEMTV